MDRSTWKKVERWWATVLGGTRVPVTGRSRGDAPDIEHSYFAVEVKAGRVLSTRLQLAMDQAEAVSNKRPLKAPLVCITHSTRGKPNRNLVMMQAADFYFLCRKAGVEMGLNGGEKWSEHC